MDLKSRRRSLHSIILEAWSCAFAGSPVAYLSGPITTGLRHIERIRGSDDSRVSKQAVIRENSEALIETAKKLRAVRNDIIVEPASLKVEEWSQADYLILWEQFIERHVRLILFMPDWEHSFGCATEFARAVEHDVRAETVSGSLITPEDGIALIGTACEELRRHDADGKLLGLAEELDSVIRRLERAVVPRATIGRGELRKDISLDHLADRGFNVAQFVSFSPLADAPKQEYSRLAGEVRNYRFHTPAEAIEAVVARSVDGTINVRSFEPSNARSREFIYGIADPQLALGHVERLTKEGLHTIVNETVDIHDGGVSGVLMGNVLEFAPDATPRCVEEPGTASLPRGWGRELLSTVYRFPIELAVPLGSRLEFSLHPKPRGWKQTNILVWEFEEHPHVEAHPELTWPNIFSRMLGDKVFGLLVAHHIGLPVPMTTVINRRVGPFSFGRTTDSGETWIRTAPVEQVPGKFTTLRGWTDPYEILHREDPGHEAIASVLSQDGVKPVYSGALIVGSRRRVILEGKRGEGESLMQGRALPERIPARIAADIRALFAHAAAALGPVRLEWVHDGSRAWVVQLHRGATETSKTQITAGEADQWIPFAPARGLEALRDQLAHLPSGAGLILKGRVGLTSHIADVIRKANVPARMEA
ncbi:MAG TPA: hypothetical protein VK614_10595 [Allosphingosinicella sp.]|nr:hypothetical protein [Allosphingosinicella sp.]